MFMTKEQKEFNKTLGKRLSIAQTLASLDDFGVGGLAGFSVQEFRSYKKGERTPNSYRLLRLAKVLNVSCDYLTGRSGEPTIS